MGQSNFNPELAFNELARMAEQTRQSLYAIDIRLNYLVEVLNPIVGKDKMFSGFDEFVKKSRGGIDKNGVMDGTLVVTRYGCAS